jgi:hypothetical protein
LAVEPNANGMPSDAAGGDNVVYLGSGGAPSGAGPERLGAGSGADTIGVNGTVLAFDRPTMAFLEPPDSGLAGASWGSAAVPGALGSLTLFSDPGLGNDLVALPAGGGLLGYSFAFDNLAGAAATGRAEGPDGFQPASVAGGNTLHLPDGTTVMLVDISKLAGSSGV